MTSPAPRDPVCRRTHGGSSASAFAPGRTARGPRCSTCGRPTGAVRRPSQANDALLEQLPDPQFRWYAFPGEPRRLRVVRRHGGRGVDDDEDRGGRDAGATLCEWCAAAMPADQRPEAWRSRRTNRAVGTCADRSLFRPDQHYADRRLGTNDDAERSDRPARFDVGRSMLAASDGGASLFAPASVLRAPQGESIPPLARGAPLSPERLALIDGFKQRPRGSKHASRRAPTRVTG